MSTSAAYASFWCIIDCLGGVGGWGGPDWLKGVAVTHADTGLSGIHSEPEWSKQADCCS